MIDPEPGTRAEHDLVGCAQLYDEICQFCNPWHYRAQQLRRRLSKMLSRLDTFRFDLMYAARLRCDFGGPFDAEDTCYYCGCASGQGLQFCWKHAWNVVRIGHTWHVFFIFLRNMIGNMQYSRKELGAEGYYWETPEWRKRLADVCGAIAYRYSPSALWRLGLIRIGLIKLHPCAHKPCKDDECAWCIPF